MRNGFPEHLRAGRGPYWCSFIIQAPWRTYMSYGDDRTLVKGYPFMQQWLAFAEQSVAVGLYFSRANGKDWGLGDWLAPQGVDVKDRESIDLVSNCAMSQCLQDMAHIAAHLGKVQDSIRYTEQLAALNSNIHRAFYHGDGTYGTLKVRWERKKHDKLLKVTIPVGVTADIFGKTYGNGKYKIEF